MDSNRHSACTTALTVSSLLLEEAEAVKEEAVVAWLWPWRPMFRPLKQLLLLPHKLVRLPLTPPMQIKLTLDPDLVVVSSNRDAEAAHVPGN